LAHRGKSVEQAAEGISDLLWNDFCSGHDTGGTPDPLIKTTLLHGSIPTACLRYPRFSGGLPTACSASKNALSFASPCTVRLQGMPLHLAP
jgi:hypothetical protein